MFALRYAYLYHNASPEPGGLDFPPASARPDYLDFAYFNLVIGMTTQTADVSISGRAIRHTTLLHGLFNTAVVAVCVSGLIEVL